MACAEIVPPTRLRPLDAPPLEPFTTAAQPRQGDPSAGALLGRASVRSPRGGLSRRELEVLGRLAAGDTNAEIAARLTISVNTVERHVSNLYGKIGARNRADATAYLLRQEPGPTIAHQRDVLDFPQTSSVNPQRRNPGKP